MRYEGVSLRRGLCSVFRLSRLLCPKDPLLRQLNRFQSTAVVVFTVVNRSGLGSVPSEIRTGPMCYETGKHTQPTKPHMFPRSPLTRSLTKGFLRRGRRRRRRRAVRQPGSHRRKASSGRLLRPPSPPGGWGPSAALGSGGGRGRRRASSRRIRQQRWRLSGLFRLRFFFGGGGGSAEQGVDGDGDGGGGGGGASGSGGRWRRG